MKIDCTDLELTIYMKLQRWHRTGNAGNVEKKYTIVKLQRRHDNKSRLKSRRQSLIRIRAIAVRATIIANGVYEWKSYVRLPNI